MTLEKTILGLLSPHLFFSRWADLVRAVKQITSLGRSEGPVMDPGLTVALFGASKTAMLLAGPLAGLGYKVVFCDNDPAKQGGLLMDKPVVSPQMLAEMGPVKIIITVDQAREAIAGQLKQLNLHSHLVEKAEMRRLELAVISDQAAFLEEHLDRLEAVHRGLEDDKSAFIYLNILRARLLPSLAALIYWNLFEGGQYAAVGPFQRPDVKSYVDVGASFGDTVESFLYRCQGRFANIHALEPDRATFERLKINLGLLVRRFALAAGCIECIGAAAGSENQGPAPEVSGPLVPDEASSLILPAAEPAYPGYPRLLPAGAGAGEMSVVSLDIFLAGREISFLKADIEGAELAMLEGAGEIIATQKPMIALSLYHKPEDLFTLPLYLKRLVPEYKTAVRHHSHLGCETVLYAWI